MGRSGLADKVDQVDQASLVDQVGRIEQGDQVHAAKVVVFPAEVDSVTVLLGEPAVGQACAQAPAL